MPVINVNLLKGRTREQIEAMIGEISKAVAHSLDAPIESVRVIVNELEDHQFGIGGRTAGEVMAERAAAEEDDA